MCATPTAEAQPPGTWSRVSPKVAKAVHRIDDIRIRTLKRLVIDAGYDDDEAFIRACITYFHQVGYYAMGVHESSSRCQELSGPCYRALTGFRNGELKAVPAGGVQGGLAHRGGIPARRIRSRGTR